MNKTLYTAILIFPGQSVMAPKGIDNLIKAEKDLAAYSVLYAYLAKRERRGGLPGSIQVLNTFTRPIVH